MLEQPPELDLSETQAEVTNAVCSQIKPTHWSFRLIVWIMPSILAVLIFWGAAYANIMLYDEKLAISYNLLILVILFTSSAVNFGIGYFDAHLSRMIHLSDGNRKNEKFVYATSFMIAQLLVIPAIVISTLILLLVVT